MRDCWFVRFSLPLICACLLLSSTAEARPPEIRNIDFRGLQVDAVTILTIDGLDLFPDPQFYLDDQLLSATLNPASTSGRVIVSLPIKEPAPNGFGQLRIRTTDGFSNSILVAVDQLPQLPISEETAKLPVALHGVVPGSGVSKTTFTAAAGEEIIAEVEARRLGSKLRPVIHIYDEARIQHGWASPSNTLAGDSRLTFKAPKAGRYTVEVHDTQYAPPGPSYFRLKLGQWIYSDLVFPPVIVKGQETALEFFGPAASVRATIGAAEGPRSILAPASNSPLKRSGAWPRLAISSLQEVIKTNANEQPFPLPGAPIGISGRLNLTGQRDRFLLPVTAGMKLTLEVFAERIGSQIDPVLELKNKAGAVLAVNDDAPNTIDSRLDFIVPAATDAIEIVVRDGLDLASPESIYRLLVNLTDASRNDFEFSIKSDTVNVPAGESQVLEAFVDRQGYSGPLQVQATGLPAGITLTGAEIPAGANGTLLVFNNPGDAAGQIVCQLNARTPDGSLVRSAALPPGLDDRTPVWLRDHIACATAPKATAPFQIAWANAEAMAQLPLASKQAVTLGVIRPPSTFGPVRLSLMSSQPVPKVNGAANPALSIRIEQVVESPVDPAVKTAGDALAAVDKLHAEAVKVAQAATVADAKVAAEAKVQELLKQKTTAEAALRDAESKAKYAPQLSLVIPATMSEPVCDLSVKAELMNPEKNLVLRTTYAPVRRLPVLNPLVIKLAGAPLLETTLDAKLGATLKVTASIERLAGYVGIINIAVTGLPAGVTAANATVNADQTQFVIELKLPANFADVEIKGLKLKATGPADPLSGNVPVKAVDLDFTVKVNK
jgi:hypothetical protein